MRWILGITTVLCLILMYAVYFSIMTDNHSVGEQYMQSCIEILVGRTTVSAEYRQRVAARSQTISISVLMRTIRHALRKRNNATPPPNFQHTHTHPSPIPPSSENIQFSFFCNSSIAPASQSPPIPQKFRGQTVIPQSRRKTPLDWRGSRGLREKLDQKVQVRQGSVNIEQLVKVKQEKEYQRVGD